MDNHRVFTTPGDAGLPVGTSYWIKYVRSRIKKNKNFLGVFTGQTGSGKSYSALNFMEELSEQKNGIENVCLRALQFMERLTSGELKPGDVLIWDETGIDLNSKQWQSLTNRVINYVMQTFRKKNLIVFFTVPYLSFIDSDTRKLIHGVFKTEKIDYEKQKTIVKPLLVQVNEETGKMYKKYLRVKHQNGSLAPIKRISFNKPNKKLLDEYEAKKEAFTNKLYQDIYGMMKKLEEKNQSNGKELTEKQQEVVVMYEKGMTEEEIAATLGIATSTVYERLNLARKKRKIIEKRKEKSVFRQISPEVPQPLLNFALKPSEVIT